jgi:hypothetical protein
MIGGRSAGPICNAPRSGAGHFFPRRQARGPRATKLHVKARDRNVPEPHHRTDKLARARRRRQRRDAAARERLVSRSRGSSAFQRCSSWRHSRSNDAGMIPAGDRLVRAFRAVLRDFFAAVARVDLPERLERRRELRPADDVPVPERVEAERARRVFPLLREALDPLRRRRAAAVEVGVAIGLQTRKSAKGSRKPAAGALLPRQRGRLSRPVRKWPALSRARTVCARPLRGRQSQFFFAIRFQRLAPHPHGSPGAARPPKLVLGRTLQAHGTHPRRLHQSIHDDPGPASERNSSLWGNLRSAA